MTDKERWADRRDGMLRVFWHRGRCKFVAWTTAELARRSESEMLVAARRLRDLREQGLVEVKSHTLGSDHVSTWKLTPKGERDARTLMQAAEVERSA